MGTLVLDVRRSAPRNRSHFQEGRMRTKPDIPPAALDVVQAAQYLNISRSHFLAVVKPIVPTVDLGKPGSPRAILRWLRTDLDAYLERRKRVA